MPAPHPVVGSWKVAVSVPGAPARTINIARLSLDGGVVVTFPSPTPAPPGANHAMEFWTPAIGAWTAAVDRDATMTFVALGVNERGAPVGAHTVSATVTAAADGLSWQGPFQIEITSGDGASVGKVQGTVAATPITAKGA